MVRSTLLHFFILGGPSGKNPRFNEICSSDENLMEFKKHLDMISGAPDFAICYRHVCFTSVDSNLRVATEITITNCKLDVCRFAPGTISELLGFPGADVNFQIFRRVGKHG